jgi:hypothetical protein
VPSNTETMPTATTGFIVAPLCPSRPNPTKALPCAKFKPASILDLYEETVPIGKTSDLDILKVAAMATPLRPPILDAATFALLNETRRFRHVAAHIYADFEPAKVDPSVAAARTLAATLPTVFSRFKAAVGDFNGAA